MNTTCSDCSFLNEGTGIMYTFRCGYCNEEATLSPDMPSYKCGNCDQVTSNIRRPYVRCRKCVTKELTGNIDKKDEMVCNGVSLLCMHCHQVVATHVGKSDDTIVTCFKCNKLIRIKYCLGCSCKNSLPSDPVVLNTIDTIKQESPKCEGRHHKCYGCNNSYTTHFSDDDFGNRRCDTCDTNTTLRYVGGSCKCILHSKVKPIVPDTIKQESPKCKGRHYKCYRCNNSYTKHLPDNYDSRRCDTCDTNKLGYIGGSCRCEPQTKVDDKKSEVKPKFEAPPTIDKQVIPVNKLNIIRLDHTDTEDVVSIGDKVVLKVKMDDKNMIVSLKVQNAEYHYTVKNE